MTVTIHDTAIAEIRQTKDTLSVLRPILADRTMGNAAQAESRLKLLIIELENNLPDSWK